MSSDADVPHVECRKAHSSAGVLEVLGESYGTSLTCALLMSFQMMMVFTMMTSKLKKIGQCTAISCRDRIDSKTD
jgi:hypothetical protein